MDELFSLAPWDTLQIFNQMALRLKQEYPLPAYTTRIATGTADYEQYIRKLWNEFKLEPTQQNAENFINALVEYSTMYWKDYMANVLGVDVNKLSAAQLEKLQEELDKHHYYLRNSLLPDLIKAIAAGTDNFNNFDYRVIFLYSGALWSFGFLSTIAFDGLQPRDAADMFIFLGPDDENTCTGERGCKQHVGKIYTVAEILVDRLWPGSFRCLTSCRHILIPVASM